MPLDEGPWAALDCGSSSALYEASEAVSSAADDSAGGAAGSAGAADAVGL